MLYQCGLGLLNCGDVQGAYEDFREAARLQPQNMEIWAKYEEAYRAVEPKIAEIHRIAEASRPPKFGDTREERALPRHFTLVVPRDTAADLAAELDESEGQEEKRQVLPRGMRKNANKSDQEQVGRADILDSSSDFFMNLREREERGSERYALNRKIYFMIAMFWMLTGAIEFYHVDYNLSSKSSAPEQNKHKMPSFSDIYEWNKLVYVLLTLALAFFAAVYWFFVRPTPPPAASRLALFVFLCLLFILISFYKDLY